jgi:hypothetical protein
LTSALLFAFAALGLGLTSQAQHAQRLSDEVADLRHQLQDQGDRLAIFEATALRLTKEAEARQKILDDLSIPSSQQAGPPQPASGWFWQWGSCDGITLACTLDTRGRASPVPDTFDMDVSFTATVPVRLTFSSWIGGGAITTYGPSLSMQHVLFTGAEGCGGYIMTVSAADTPGVIYPNVWVRYHPAPRPTGVCG